MILLEGARVVLRDRVLEPGAVVLDGAEISAVHEGRAPHLPGAARVDLSGHLLLPGFIDVHVHGAGGIDVLDGAGAVAALAALLPRHGVTAFCPTTVACEPSALSAVLAEIAALRAGPAGRAARVLRAHLESNFLEPSYRGAQPAACLRRPPSPDEAAGDLSAQGGAFSGADVLAAIDRHADSVGIVTLAPELEGGLDLVRRLRAAGIRVSIGHTAADYAQARAAIAAGVGHATHLFNRMPPLSHRAPGAAAAVLLSSEVAAEIICDGVHVHPAMIRLALGHLGPGRVLGITDGTAGAGLPVGTRTHLGGQEIVVTTQGARLADGTLAGSVQTMDGAFRVLVREVGLGEADASRLLATTPAEQLGLQGLGEIRPGAAADLVVLTADLAVAETVVGGVPLLGSGLLGAADPR